MLFALNENMYVGFAVLCVVVLVLFFMNKYIVNCVRSEINESRHEYKKRKKESLDQQMQEINQIDIMQNHDMQNHDMESYVDPGRNQQAVQEPAQIEPAPYEKTVSRDHGSLQDNIMMRQIVDQSSGRM